MDAFWDWLGNTELAFQIGATWWFPLLESIHVLSVVFLVGAITMADLRLLGLTGKRYPARQFVSELTPWAWGALVPAVITGLGMFISRPAAYAANPAFQLKLLALVLLAANVAFLHGRKSVDLEKSPSASYAGLASLVLWLGVLLAGRWVGHLN